MNRNAAYVIRTIAFLAFIAAALVAGLIVISGKDYRPDILLGLLLVFVSNFVGMFLASAGGLSHRWYLGLFVVVLALASGTGIILYNYSSFTGAGWSIILGLLSVVFAMFFDLTVHFTKKEVETTLVGFAAPPYKSEVVKAWLMMTGTFFIAWFRAPRRP